MTDSLERPSCSVALEDTFDLPNVDSTNSLWCEAPGNLGGDRYGVVEIHGKHPFQQSKTSPMSFVLKLSSRKHMLYTQVWLTNDLLVCKTTPEWDGEVPWKVTRSDDHHRSRTNRRWSKLIGEKCCQKSGGCTSWDISKTLELMEDLPYRLVRSCEPSTKGIFWYCRQKRLVISGFQISSVQLQHGEIAALDVLQWILLTSNSPSYIFSSKYSRTILKKSQGYSTYEKGLAGFLCYQEYEEVRK